MGDGHDVMLRKLKLANDLLGNCGLASELMAKHPGRESLDPFLDDYKIYLKTALRMFDGFLKEDDNRS